MTDITEMKNGITRDNLIGFTGNAKGGKSKYPAVELTMGTNHEGAVQKATVLLTQCSSVQFIGAAIIFQVDDEAVLAEAEIGKEYNLGTDLVVTLRKNGKHDRILKYAGCDTGIAADKQAIIIAEHVLHMSPDDYDEADMSTFSSVIATSIVSGEIGSYTVNIQQEDDHE